MSYRIKSRWFPTAVFLITVLGAISLDAAAVDLVTNVDGAEVQVSVAVESIVVGARADFLVTVTPVDGQSIPNRVRGRFGMPDHGHWTTDEQTYVTVPGAHSGMKFSGEFPMRGHYRFRIWIDYPDGRTVKTAVDFSLETDQPVEPMIVP